MNHQKGEFEEGKKKKVKVYFLWLGVAVRI